MSRISSKAEFVGRVVGHERYTPGNDTTKDLAIGISSGTTTGTPTLIIHDREHSASDDTFLHKTDIYDSNSAILRLSRSAQNTHRMLTEVWSAKRPARLLPLTKDEVDAPNFPEIVRAFAPTHLQSPPSMTIYMLNTLKEAGASETLAFLQEHITVLEFSAEKMTETQRDVIRTFLPHATFYSHYSLTELPWWIAVSCPIEPDPDTAKHCVSKHFTDAVQILDPDTDGKGEIVIHSQELGDYRTGDLGVIEPQQCTCGSTKKLTLLGRTDYDIVQCVGATLLVDEIDRVFETLSEYVTDYHVEVSEKATDKTKIQGHVHVTIVPTDALKTHPTPELTIKKAFEKQLFVTPTKVLAQLVDDGTFLPTSVLLADAIPRRNKKIRLQRI